MRHALCVTPILALIPLLVACDDGGKKRPIGATCTTSSVCESGICGGGVCLDPEVDTDLDGLVNRVEAALGTDPTRADSDGDGKSDSDETNGGSFSNPRDYDGDGRNDGIESLYVDSDGDCIPDERDGAEGVVETDLAVVADLSCCCDGRCSDLGASDVTAQCVPVEGGGDFGCRADTDCPDGATCNTDSGVCEGAGTDPGGSGQQGSGELPAGGSSGAVIAQQQVQLICSGTPASGALWPSCRGGSDTGEPVPTGGECTTACEIGFATCGDDPAVISRCSPVADTDGCYAMQDESCPEGEVCTASLDGTAECGLMP